MRNPVSCERRMSTMAFDCSSSSSKRFSRLVCASDGVLLARMMCTTSSMLSQAMINPSRMCALSCAFLRSNWVRRIVTSRLWSTKCPMHSRKLSSCGLPFTSAIQFTENELCRAVILKSLLRITLALASRFTSTTIRIPCRPVSSFTFDIPSRRPSFTSSAIYSMSCCLFTP